MLILDRSQVGMKKHSGDPHGHDGVPGATIDNNAACNFNDEASDKPLPLGHLPRSMATDTPAHSHTPSAGDAAHAPIAAPLSDDTETSVRAFLRQHCAFGKNGPPLPPADAQGSGTPLGMTQPNAREQLGKSTGSGESMPPSHTQGSNDMEPRAQDHSGSVAQDKKSSNEDAINAPAAPNRAYLYDGFEPLFERKGKAIPDKDNAAAEDIAG